MEIRITEQALGRIQELRPGKKALRINGELIGGCGMNVDYSLVWDEPLASDKEVEVGGLNLLIDDETIAFIGESVLTIDYRENQGFRLVTPAQIIAYGIQLKDRWA